MLEHLVVTDPVLHIGEQTFVVRTELQSDVIEQREYLGGKLTHFEEM